MKTGEMGLPNTGEVIAFMVDCLGVRKRGNKDSFKEYDELKKLKKGGLATDEHGRIARKILEASVASFMDPEAAQKTTEKVLKQKIAAPVRRILWRDQNGVLIPTPEFGAPKEAIYWKRNADGELDDFGEVLVHDWTEFLFRHDYLVSKCGDCQTPRNEAILPWLCMFALPFLAQNLIEYIRNDSRLERGMPRGKFWYLPLPIRPKEGDEKLSFKWPINTVLEWWEDLLGCELTKFAHLLSDAGDDPDNARRQVRAWRYENRPPNQEAIDRWCKVSWREMYRGVFVDDTSLPLIERWRRCREFLIRKALHNPNRNWLEAADTETKKMLQTQYRGELLELEILPFSDVPFANFFNSPDPIAARLPVAEFIDRIAERYAPPTNGQLKARLLMAAAFQRACTKSLKSLGTAGTIQVLDWFQKVYCFLMKLSNRANTAAEARQFLRETPETELMLRYSCEWLFEDRSWQTLPDEIHTVINLTARNRSSKPV